VAESQLWRNRALLPNCQRFRRAAAAASAAWLASLVAGRIVGVLLFTMSTDTFSRSTPLVLNPSCAG